MRNHSRFLALALGIPVLGFGEIPEPFNTEKSTSTPLSPEEAVSKWKLPEGFQATVFAAEPDVRQPISMCLDDRGRLWVAESYTYSGQSGGYYETKLKDRIVILEDTDGDGKHDKRTVFCDGLERLISVEVGLGGVWALTLPTMIFIPDKNRDDQPDGPAEIKLDGFDIKSAHTMANGLKWGPDGWLYGRQGILGTSFLGVPGAAQTSRTRVNTGIWRFHPQRNTVELVCEGTTNPWGMDWNAYGEAFFINTVIGHLWHVIPGAHYTRMFGQDNNPHVYQLIDQHADHVHWDTRESWSDVRKGLTAESSSTGGGHAHTGLMIYQGDNWPEQYRGQLFTINFHGRRLNQETLERTGSGYTGRRAPDIAQSADEWFRGIDLLSGPDGGVFVSDWSDTGECHDDDGVNRQSGRIYKITHGKPAAPAVANVAALATKELLPLLASKNDWFARRARLQLQERTAAGEHMAEVAVTLQKQFAEASDSVLQLRALWSLHAIGKADGTFLRKQLGHASEYVRAWAIRLLLDDKSAAGSDVETLAALINASANEASPFVRLALASALQRVPLTVRAAMARPLLMHAEDANDHDLPLMLWYGIESLDPAALAELGEICALPTTRICIARRLSESMNDANAALATLFNHAVNAPPAWQSDLLTGMSEALQGVHHATPPAAWAQLSAKLAQSKEETINELYRKLGAVFGDLSALALSKAMALDSTLTPAIRRSALKSLIEARAETVRSLCETLFPLAELTATAAEGLALSDDAGAAEFMISNYAKVSAAERPAVISTLLTRPTWVAKLLDAVEGKKLAPQELSAFHVRQIRAMKDPVLSERLAKLWGEAHESSADKLALIKKWKDHLTPAVLAKADKSAGRALFTNVCGVCHKMYGQGGSVGPELTGGGRDNLDYLLTNIADPSAVVAKAYQLSILSMKDGRTLSGMIRSQDDRVVNLQTMTDSMTLLNGDIGQTQTIPTSLMPEGLLNALTEDQVRDLLAWLMDKNPSATKETKSTAVTPAEISLVGDWEIKVKSTNPPVEAELDVTPPIVNTVTAEEFKSLPVYNPTGGGWNNGAKLAGNIAEACATPELIDVPTLVLRAAADPNSATFVRGKDWEIENSWGTFGRLAGGAITEQTPVFASYKHTSLRLDAIVLGTDGKLTIRQGKGAPAAPQVPAIAAGETHLANIWIPGPISKLTADHLFPISESAFPNSVASDKSAIEKSLPRVLAKLQNGEPLRILAWGDSVTECVYLPQQEKWQEQFATRLRAAYPKAKIELLSEGWGGRSTASYLAASPGSGRNFKEKVLDVKPDLIISEFVNDAGLSPDAVETQYGKMLTDFQSIGAEWIILSPHYVRPSWMALTREKEIDNDARPYVAGLRAFATKHPVALADASARYGRLWRQGIPYSSLMVNSINHPNTAGMKIFADALMELFR